MMLGGRERGRRRSRAHVLVGPTAAGKTAVAHYLALRGGAPLVSADAMLVYRGMDIGTAKPSLAERAAVAYGGLDCVDPSAFFSVFDWLRAVTPLFVEGRGGAVPMVVGGTGLYVTALLQGLDPLPASDPERRAFWERVLAQEGVEGLRRALLGLSVERFQALRDASNPRRLIRSLLLAEAGVPLADAQGAAPLPAGPVVGLRLTPELLHARMVRRVEAMYAAGLLEEVRGLRAAGLSATALQAIGYREALDCLDGVLTMEEAMAATVRRTRLLAKRQYTWFRRQCAVDWVDVVEGVPVEVLAQRVQERWEALGPATVVLPEEAEGEGRRHVQDCGDEDDDQGDARAAAAARGTGPCGG